MKVLFEKGDAVAYRETEPLGDQLDQGRPVLRLAVCIRCETTLAIELEEDAMHSVLVPTVPPRPLELPPLLMREAVDEFRAPFTRLLYVASATALAGAAVIGALALAIALGMVR